MTRTRERAKKFESLTTPSTRKKGKTTAKKHPSEIRPYGIKTAFSESALTKALGDIRSGKLKIGEAAMKYKIHCNTLRNKLNGKHAGKVGRPFVFSHEVECAFIDHALVLCNMDIPIGSSDVREIAKGYLDSKNIIVPHFRDNRPGWDWAQNVMKRFQLKISNKLANKVCTARANVNEKQVITFFGNYEREKKDVPPENIFNMDESGFHDEPSKKKVLLGREVRNPEIIMNTSKSFFTVVFCVNALGNFLPPFIIFRGKELDTDWLVGGLPQAKMTSTSSGWIRIGAFEEEVGWNDTHYGMFTCGILSFLKGKAYKTENSYADW